MCLHITNRETIPGHMGRLDDIEVFALGCVKAEYFQCRPGFAGINTLHIGILLKYFIQFFLMDILDFSPERNRNSALGGR